MIIGLQHRQFDHNHDDSRPHHHNQRHHRQLQELLTPSSIMVVITSKVCNRRMQPAPHLLNSTGTICTMLQCVGLSVHRVEKGIYQYPWLCSHPSLPPTPTQTSIETRVGCCCGQFKADDKSHEVSTSCFSRPRASPTPLQAPSSSFVIIEQELRRAYRQVAWDILYSC